ncbi:MAG: polysaccharide biosynthesis tyrosine autokinase [Planctomycetota bacterium]|nr:MAG: polysaccharide biosynthesis tyrosine autokinase [Planctomycetota bacterium]
MINNLDNLKKPRNGDSGSVFDAPLQAVQETFVETVWRERWIVLAALVISLAAAFIYLAKATPIFTGTSRIYIEQSGPEIVKGLESAMTQSKNYLYTQAELLKSTPVLAPVLQKPEVKRMKVFQKVDDPVVFLKKKGLDVSVSKKSDIITISSDSPEPTEAAELVNAVVDSYVTYHSTHQRGTAADVLRILQKEKTKREAELAAKADAMARFRQENAVSITENLDGDILLERLNRLQLQLADLSRQVTDEHPAVKAAKDKIEQIKKQSELIAQYTILHSEWERTKKLCDILDDHIKQINITEDTGALNINILEVARPAEEPSKPQKSHIISIAMVVGLMLGCGLAFLHDYRDHKLRSTPEINTSLGVPVLGVVPTMSRKETVFDRGQKVRLESNSPVAEAYRNIRTAVFFSVPDGKAKTLLVTSPTAGDGKTTLASNLAIAMAQAGQKTLVLDADFRKPMQHEVFQAKRDGGLTSLLAASLSLQRVIHPTCVKNLDLMTAGPEAPNPSEMLNSSAFAGTLKALADRYDRVIIDSPPVMSVTDARILAALCDVTLLVLKADKSTRKISRLACDGLLSVGAHLLGVVVNQVSKTSSRYSYYSPCGYGYYGRAQTKKGMEATAG